LFETLHGPDGYTQKLAHLFLSLLKLLANGAKFFVGHSISLKIFSQDFFCYPISQSDIRVNKIFNPQKLFFSIH